MRYACCLGGRDTTNARECLHLGKTVFMIKKTQYIGEKKLIVVFDIDETLINIRHCHNEA